LNNHDPQKYISRINTMLVLVAVFYCVSLLVPPHTAIAEDSPRSAKGTDAKKEEIPEQIKKVAAYLQKAETELNENEFDSARDYVEKARQQAADEARRNARESGRSLIDIVMDEGNREARSRLLQIDEAEKEYAEEQQRIKEREIREEQEAEARKQAGKIAEYLAKAQELVDKNEFAKARSYVNKALEINMKVREDSEKKAKKRTIKKGPAGKAERPGKDEKRARKVAKYVEDGRKLLEKKKFKSARSRARKALRLDPDNKEAQLLLTQTAQKQKEYKDRRERRRRERREGRTISGESAAVVADRLGKASIDVKKNGDSRAKDYAKRGVEIKEEKEEAPEIEEETRKLTGREVAEARQKAKKKKLAEKRAKKAKKYVTRAKKYLAKNNFGRARSCAKKALKLDKDNTEAQEILSGAIGQVKELSIEEELPREKPESAKRGKGKKKEIRLAAKEQTKRETQEKYRRKKVNAYLRKAQKYISREDYSTARRFAHKARDLSPESTEVAEVIMEIEKKDMFGEGAREKEAKRKKAAKTYAKTKEEDPFYKYDEGKSWMELVTEMFVKGTVESEETQIIEGREYTIDKCVQIALRRSQRMVVADKQVKLAETRLWETRRELLPSLTGKFEQSFGKVGTTGGPRHYIGKKIKVEMKYTMFDGMGMWFKLRQSQTNVDIVKLEREKRLYEIIEETRKAYYNLDKTTKALDVQGKLKETVNDLYDVAEKAYHQDLVPHVEYLKVKGQNAQANFQRISAVEDVSLAEIVLFQAMAMSPDQHIKIKPVEEPGLPLTIGLENCYMLAMANRPDFKIKEKTIEYYEFERKMMKAKGWPKIDFHGSYGRSQENYEPLREDEAKRGLSPEWFAGFKGSWPFWGNTLEYNYVKEKWAAGYSSYKESIGSETATSYYNIKLLDDMAYFSNLEESKVGFESAKYEYAKAKKDLTIEVKEAYFKYRKALLQMDVAKAKVEHQRMFVGVVEERRLYGEMEISKTIEEHEKLAGDEYSLVHGNASYFTTLTALNKAVGIPGYFGPGCEKWEYEEWIEKPVPAGNKKKTARRKDSEKESLRRAEKIARYLQEAERKLSENKFRAARNSAKKALAVDEKNRGAQVLLKEIVSAEAAYKK